MPVSRRCNVSHAVELATFLASGSASGPGKINMLVYDDIRSISVLLRLPRTVGKASEGLLRTAGIQERRLDCGRMNGTAKQGTDMPTQGPLIIGGELSTHFWTFWTILDPLGRKK